MAVSPHTRMIGTMICSLALVTMSVASHGCARGSDTSRTSLSLLSDSDIGVDDIAGIPRGITQAELAAQLGGAGTTEFIARIGRNEVQCLSYAFGHPSVLTYYYVFTNGRLSKVIERPPFEYETLLITEGEFQGGKEGRRKAVLPERRLESVMRAPDLDANSLRHSLTNNLQIIADRQRRAEPANIAPALIATAPLRAALTPLVAIESGHRQQLARRFDPNKVSLGDGVADVDNAFGDARAVIEPTERRQIRAYGRSTGEELDGGEIISWVMVQLDDGAVTRVFAHDFVDIRFIALDASYR